MTGAAFYTRVVCDRNLVFFPLVHVCWTYADAYEVEWAFDAHLWIFDPEMRLLIYLVPISIELVSDAHQALRSHEKSLQR